MNRTISTIVVVALIALSSTKRTSGTVQHVQRAAQPVTGLYVQDRAGNVEWSDDFGFDVSTYCDSDGERAGCSIGNPIIR